MEFYWRRLVDGSSRYGGEETGAEEDRQDGEVLDGVRDRDTCVPCSEGILDVRAQVVRENHFLSSVVVILVCVA